MNERQEQTADVLGKLTVLGTIVLPLNIICGMWGMNVKVPGQDVDSLSWFYSSEFSPPEDRRYHPTMLTCGLCSHRWVDLVRPRLLLHCQTRLQDCVRNYDDDDR